MILDDIWIMVLSHVAAAHAKPCQGFKISLRRPGRAAAAAAAVAAAAVRLSQSRSHSLSAGHDHRITGIFSQLP